MAPFRATRRMWVRQWPLIGLLLVVSFLGHDLLMTGEVAAAPRSETGAAHHRPGPHAHQDGAHAPPTHEPTPAHPAICGVGQSAVPRGGDVFDQTDGELTTAPSVLHHAGTADSHTGAVLWEEPRWPPGTLRALFQVYRI